MPYFRSISSENKGFKMLSKLGWSEGQTLGKNQDGLSEPVRETNKQIIAEKTNIKLFILNLRPSDSIEVESRDQRIRM